MRQIDSKAMKKFIDLALEKLEGEWRTELSKSKDKDAYLKTVTQNAVKHSVDLMIKRLGTSASLEAAGLGATDIDALLRQIGDQHGVKLGDLAQPMRLAMTGALVSAGLFELLSLLPWKLVEARLRSIETW